MPSQPLGASFLEQREMAQGKQDKKRFTVRMRISENRMRIEDWHAAERLLAKLIARSYAADHPELFGPQLDGVLGRNISESSSAARAVSAAPAAKDGDSEKRSVEHDERESS